ncbi:MAG: Translation initiation factor 3 [uncultured Campylobacterales bacterium]|uniref:Translation initiation factor IF-3 n=1 Tax=uncultured Campylobacterales bacterium TaxID=352960 RepID=A0A6S6SAC0_9BACT|nr:MAG: Translation initiation factor 3 [uncultured Campylobacterales bacterium]
MRRDNNLRKKKDDTLLNENIRLPEVRCTSDDGTSHGIISSAEALAIANDEGLDLVLISPNAKPPVCKIMDYGKFKYEQEKKKKEARKNQKKIDVKEIKFSVKIAQNDIDYKVKHSREFLAAGKHVKMRVFLKGREMAHPQSGVEILEQIWKLVEDVADRDGKPKLDGRYVNMLVVPKK